MNNILKKISVAGLALVTAGTITACNKTKNDSGGNGSNPPMNNDFVYSEIIEINKKYDVTPTIQNANYLDNGFKLKKDSVNVVLENGVDGITKARLENILSSNNMTYTYSEKGKNEHVNIFVGIDGSNSYVDKYMNEKDKPNDDLFSKIDAYQMYVNNGVISILGKDSDSVFYGVNTLDQILDFASNNNESLVNVKIEDYATTARRGVIEGFYGFPWTTEERIDMVEWGSKYKMNNFVFAPKDDEYHSAKWRELYPQEKLSEMKRLADAAKNNKVEFTWAIHPFMHGTPFNFDNYNDELNVVKAKFEQLYSIGVRSFALSADDIAVPNFEGDDAANKKLEWFTTLALNHVKIAKDLLTWTNSLEEKVEWQFIPTTYCGTNDEAQLAYLAEVGKALPQEFGQHWTGEQVYGTLSKSTIDDFKNRTDRLPVFWLNSPVNDSFGVCENIFMPKMTVLNTDVEQIAGLLVNPSPYPEASKIAIYQALDYSWNIKGFNHDSSYRKSFDSIENDKNLAEQLYIFASNLQSTEHLSNGWIPQLNKEESPLLVPLINELLEHINEEMVNTDISIYTTPLNDEFERIITAIDTYQEKGNNKALITDIKPWMDSLKDLCKAGIKYLDSVNATANGEFEKAKQLLVEANQIEADSQSKYTKKIFIIGSERDVNCSTGEVTIRPFYKNLQTKLSPILNK